MNTINNYSAIKQNLQKHNKPDEIEQLKQAEHSTNPTVQYSDAISNYNKANINFKGFPPTIRLFDELVCKEYPNFKNAIKIINERVFPSFEKQNILKPEDFKFLKECFNHFWSDKNITDKFGTYSIYTNGSMATNTNSGHIISNEAKHILLTLEFNLNKAKYGEDFTEFAEQLLTTSKTIMALKKEGKNKEINDLISNMKSTNENYKFVTEHFLQFHS